MNIKFDICYLLIYVHYITKGNNSLKIGKGMELLYGFSNV